LEEDEKRNKLAIEAMKTEADKRAERELKTSSAMKDIKARARKRGEQPTTCKVNVSHLNRVCKN